MYNPGADQEKVPYYPPQSSGYPPQSPSYPPQSPSYPPQSPSYPTAPVPVQQQPTSHLSNTNTTVVIQQQAAQVVVQGPRGWSSGLCACFDDCGVCLLGLCSLMCCLPILECNVSSSAGECCCVGSCCPIALRTKIRTRHNIQGSIMEDCCTLACCYYCAMCQMAREVNMNGM